MKAYGYLLVIIAVVTLFLYRYVDAQNGLLALRRTLPPLAKEVRAIQEDNLRLEYEVAVSLSPQRLWQLARRPEYGHLYFPSEKEIIRRNVKKESLSQEEIDSF